MSLDTMKYRTQMKLLAVLASKDLVAINEIQNQESREFQETA